MDDKESETFSDWDELEDDLPVKSLFCEREFPSIPEMIGYDKNEFDFDLKEIATSIGSDDIDLIMAVNYIRCQVVQNPTIDSSFINQLKQNLLEKTFTGDEKYMLPVLKDDPLLFDLRASIFDDAGDEDDALPTLKSTGTISNTTATESKDVVIGKYKEILAALVESDPRRDDGYYFDGYSHISIHETMLRDHSRTSAYAAAIERNKSIVEGKVVLDIGCGTGILCLLAARAGAKKVIGIDLSGIVDYTRSIVARNGFEDVITIVRGRLEDTELPLEPGEVDVIVSEWMGYALYYENMLTSVLFAKERYLKSSGTLMPSKSSLYLEAISCDGEDDRVAWWENVYGFNMEDLKGLLTVEAQVQLVDQEAVVSDRAEVHILEISSATDSDLDFEAPFSLVIQRDSILKAFAISFDVLFGGLGYDNEVTLSTGIAADPTHWKQTLLWIAPENRTGMVAGDLITGTLTYTRREENNREYSISMKWSKVRPPFPSGASVAEGGGLVQESSIDVYSQTFMLVS